MRISDWLWQGEAFQSKLHLTERPAARIRYLRGLVSQRTAGRFMLLAMDSRRLCRSVGLQPDIDGTAQKDRTYRISGEIPPFKLDSRASMVVYEGNVSPDEGDADEVRDVLASMLQTRFGQRE